MANLWMKHPQTRKNRIKRFFVRRSGSKSAPSMMLLNSLSMIFISTRPNFASGSSLPRSWVHRSSTIIELPVRPIWNASSQISGCHTSGANLEPFNFPSKWCMSTSKMQLGNQRPKIAEDSATSSGSDFKHVCSTHKLKNLQNSCKFMKCGADFQIDSAAALP